MVVFGGTHHKVEEELGEYFFAYDPLIWWKIDHFQNWKHVSFKVLLCFYSFWKLLDRIEAKSKSGTFFEQKFWASSFPHVVRISKNYYLIFDVAPNVIYRYVRRFFVFKEKIFSESIQSLSFYIYRELFCWSAIFVLGRKH